MHKIFSGFLVLFCSTIAFAHVNFSSQYGQSFVYNSDGHSDSENIYIYDVTTNVRLGAVPGVRFAGKVGAMSLSLDDQDLYFSLNQIGSGHALFAYNIATQKTRELPLNTVAGLQDADYGIIAIQPVDSGLVVATQNSLFSFNFDGELLSQLDGQSVASKFQFNALTGSLYWSPDKHSERAISAQSALINGSGELTSTTPTAMSPTYMPVPPIALSPNGNQLIARSGEIISTATLQVTSNIGEYSDQQLWLDSGLVTAHNGKLKVWQPGEQNLLAELPLPVSTEGLFAWKTGVLAIGERSGYVTHNYFDLVGDSDSDSHADIVDNCPQLANPDQLDTDTDGLGDACDTDSDNDGINNTFEVENGLDPLDNSDAALDSDADTFSNLLEFIYSTNPGDAKSMPAATSDLVIDFESDTNLSHLAGSNGLITNTASLLGQSSYGVFSGQTKSLTISGYFEPGYLGFYTLSARSVTVKVNGSSQMNSYSRFYPWSNNYVQFTERGQYTIEISARDSDYLLVDHIRFSANYLADIREDRDLDGIADSRDNCLYTANYDQLDSNNNYIGDACDLDADGDYMLDAEETKHGFDPNYMADANDDYDGDGASNLAEVRLGTNPKSAASKPSVSSGLVTDFSDGNVPSWLIADYPSLITAEPGTLAIYTPGNKSLDLYIYGWFTRGNVALEIEAPAELGNINMVSQQLAIFTNFTPSGSKETVSVAVNNGFNVIKISSSGTNTVLLPEGATVKIHSISASEIDSDKDGVGNSVDNCIDSKNADQADLDNDGIGDVCDSDRDGDGMSNDVEMINGLNPDDPSDVNAQGTDEQPQTPSTTANEEKSGSFGYLGFAVIALMLYGRRKQR